MKIFLTALLFSSCAHYSMASSTEVISVPAFTVEAENDLDGAQLAFALVSRLEHFGLNSRFGNDQEGEATQIRCHVLTDSIIHSEDSQGVGITRIKLTCNSPSKEFSRSLVSGAHMNDTSENRQLLLQSTATDAVEDLSAEISKHFISIQKRER